MSVNERLTTFVLLVMFGIACSLGFVLGQSIAFDKGVEAGEARAINPRDPSERLETACTGLWIGDQNKKYYEKYGKGEK
jgi:hypothetical protein